MNPTRRAGFSSAQLPVPLVGNQPFGSASTPRSSRRLPAWAGWALLAWLVGFSPSLPGLQAQPPSSGLLREVYQNIPGGAVSDLTSAAIYPNSPTSSNYVTLFEAPSNVLDNYGQRLRGFVVPPVSGNYTFWIASDDGGQLSLSTDDNPANRRPIATVNAWTGSREWTKELNQQSAPVNLQAGQAYYIEALMKEGGGGDNLAVRWLRPDGVDQGPIPGAHLLPWGVAFRAPAVTRPPQDTNAIEGRLATFDVIVDPLGPPQLYQWRRNGTAIPGATNAVLSFGPVKLADSGSTFSVFLSNSLGSATSPSATLTVTPDPIPPEFLGVYNLGATNLQLRFNESLAPVTATNRNNYLLNNGVTVRAAALSADGLNVTLQVTPLTFGVTYRLTVTNLTDLAVNPNPIAPGTFRDFTALEVVPATVGSTGLPVEITRTGPGGFNVSGGGGNIGGTTDQFSYAWERRSGDFDLQLRMAALTLPDPYVHAGLMLRETLDPGSRHAAVFGSSILLGAFFETRTTAGGAASTQSIPDGFPVNYPDQWLRLRRQGTTLTGFASHDGRNWVQLGTSSLGGLAAEVYVGFAVASFETGVPVAAQFREYGNVTSTTVVAFQPTREPSGPFVRGTGLVVSEIMYHPRPDPAGRNLEFIEIHNAGSIFEDLSGMRLDGEVGYVFPAGTRLNAGDFLVVAANPAHLRDAYGITNVLGPYTNALSNAGGVVQLRGLATNLLFEIGYHTAYPWPASPDGAGHSLVLNRPTYGPGDFRSWSASARIGGSPGGLDPAPPSPSTGVVINEFLAHTDDPQVDFIELFNRAGVPADLSGLVLTDDPSTNKFRFPAGTTLAARSHRAVNQNELGFRLDAAGESIYLIDPAGNRVLDAFRFGAQENGVSTGRQPDGSAEFRRLAAPTPGAANATWRPEEIVINELMTSPVSHDSDEEYVELFNRSAAPIDLADWRFTDGIDYRFPAGASIPAGGFVVVARDPSRLRASQPHLTTANTFGGYQGSLSDRGERVALAKPDLIVSTNSTGLVVTNRIWIDVAEVTYVDGGRWGRWFDAGGSSLELVDPDADPLRAANWADSDESQKATWQTYEFTGRLDNAVGDSAYAPNRFHLLMLGDGQCLVDDIEVIRSGSTTNALTNGGFEAGATGWSFTGNHRGSAVVTTGAASGTSCLRLAAPQDGDTGVNSVRTAVFGIANNTTVTIRARLRWLAGFPEMLFRFRGNGLEFPVRMQVPANLGTPGLANSRRVPNAGPAIFDVTHFPPVPQGNQEVLVTARVSDPDGIGSVRLVSRVDPATTTSTVDMRDDGALGDAVAGDGVYTARLTGRAGGTLVAFRVTATDAAGAPASVFPADAPTRECLIRWGDPIPFGTFPHYHLWSTAATESARGSSIPLDNTYRDATLVHRNNRVIYNAGFRDKGSPYHGGAADFAVQVPDDDRLLNATTRVFGQTGNGGTEDTGLRGQVANWIARRLGIPFLNASYMQLYRNGGQYANVTEDLEEPDNPYAERWFPPADGNDGKLHKISVWFEFQDNNQTFAATSATLQRFTTLSNEFKTARYRWNWENRPQGPTASDFRHIFDLVTAANVATSSAAYVPGLLNLADMDNWMRVFAFNRVIGNWDSYTYSVGQNMYLYQPSGGRFVLMPWDIDFVLGLGGGATEANLLGGGQDPIGNNFFNNFTFRRMLWRAYQDAINGPLQTAQYSPQIAARREVLDNNGVGGLAATNAVYSYMESRRNYLRNQLNAADSPVLEITSNGGADFSTSTGVATLTGRAPIAGATLTVNGTPWPANWTSVTAWSLNLPLTEATNRFTIGALDRSGQPLAGLADTITVVNTGALPRPEDFVAFNEIQYNAAAPGASFIELFNRSTTTPFSLAGFRLDGVGYTFPAGAVINPNSYLVLAKDRAGFAAAYGNNVAVFDVFPGNLDNDGERLALVRPDPTGGPNETVIDDVRYANTAPWPATADGFGPSLQLLDAFQDTWRVANWGVTATNDVNRATPARANANRVTLDPFPEVWINEIQPLNASGPADNAGQRDPWIELHNRGTNAVDLGGLFLTDTYTNLTRWQFPAGTTLGAGQFLVLWADGDTAQNAAGFIHLPFRLNSVAGSIALSRLQNGAPAVLDYVDYRGLLPDRSLGCIPDGDPRFRRVLQFATAGAANNPAVPLLLVTVNEFLAGNTVTLRDPADNDFDDWIELHNAGTVPADLSGYYLTDNLTNWNQFRIPPGFVIPPGGFALVWADNEPGQYNGSNDLHASFQLARGGEQLGLFDPNGGLVDGFTFPEQTNDLSSGRFPDGAGGGLVTFASPTPRAANQLAGGNQPPTLAAIGNRTVNEGAALAFRAQATDPDAGQTLTYSLVEAPPGADLDSHTGDFSWTPSETQGPGSFFVTLRATDSGLPARYAQERFSITVNEVNQAPILPELADRNVDEGTQLAFRLEASDADRPTNTLAYALVEAPDGAALDPASGQFTWTPAENQGPGTYTLKVRVTDDATPPLAAERTFTVTVNEVNNPPILAQLPLFTVLEGGSLSITNSAADPDTPPATLRFSLDPGAPAAMRIDPVTGVITWTTTEDDGPGSYAVVVRVTEQNVVALSTSRTFSVRVDESNTAPTLDPLPDLEVWEGTRVAVTAAGRDTDRPAQVLSYSLNPGTPAGAGIDSVTGEFTWNVPADQGRSTNVVTVRVTDSGPGNLSATQSFRIITRPVFNVVLNEIMYRPAAAGGRYLELLNASSSTAWDLSGFLLQGRNLQFTFPAGTLLAPGGLLCVVENLTAFRAAYGPAPVVAGAWSGTLEAGDVLRLIEKRAGLPDVEQDLVRFASTAPWPAAANGAGAALQLIDARADNNRPGNWSATAAYNGPRDLVVMTNQWRYYQSGPLAAGWPNPGFNDSAWPSGRALLYVETADLAAAKNTALTLGQNTYYFRTTFVLPSVPAEASLVLRHFIDDGAVFYLNGQEIHRFTMPTNTPIDFNTLAAAVIGDAAEVGPITLPASALVTGTNVLAVEVHQVNAGSSDIVFGASLYLEGGNAIAFTPGAPNNVAATLPAFPALYLNEVQPQNVNGITDRFGEREPWIELANTGTIDVSLDGWFLSPDPADPGRWAFPAGSVIQPGQLLIIFADAEPGESSATEWHTGFRLAPTNGIVVLSRNQPGGIAPVDSLGYSGAIANAGYIPEPAAPAGTSRVAAPSPGFPNSSTENRAPVVAALDPQTAAEGSLLEVNIAASDPDAGQQLTLSFAEPPPAGATLLPTAGPFAAVFVWTPSETQGPSTNTFVIRATDNGLPPRSAETVLRVVVTEVNQPPVFALVPSQTARVGEVFTYQLAASDADRPTQALAFSKVSGPANLSVSGPGLVLWTPNAGEEGTRPVTVRVTDSGNPLLSAEQTFTIEVLPGTGLQISAAQQGDNLQLTFPVGNGVSYRVELTDRFPPQWTTLQQGVGAGIPVQVIDPINPQRTLRLYRVVLP